MTEKLDVIESRIEMLEASLDKHNNLLYGINYLNVPGVAEKITDLERSIKRAFWILTIFMALGWMATIVFIIAILVVLV